MWPGPGGRVLALPGSTSRPGGPPAQWLQSGPRALRCWLSRGRPGSEAFPLGAGGFPF